jgi:FkbM family methyltransferase
VSLASTLAYISRNSPLGRGWVRRQLIKLAEKSASGPILTTFRGTTIIVPLGGYKPVFARSYDFEELDFLLEFLKHPDSVFVDIGANIGVYSQWLAARMSTNAKIIAIEPSEFVLNLKENLALLPCKPEISIFNCAISNKDRWISFEGGRVREVCQQVVRARTLASVIREAGCDQVSALKIDVEGHEDQALVPFFQQEPRKLWPTAIVMEHVHSNEWRCDVVGVLVEKGYRVVGRTRSNVLLSL